MGGGAANDAHNNTSGTAAADTAAAPKASLRSPGIINVIVNAAGQGTDVIWAISSVSVSSGRFKHNFAGAMPDYLHAYFTDDAGNRLDSNLFENPLQTHTEYPTEQGPFASAITSSSSGTAYLRANNNPAITMLHIYNADNRKIASFNLTEYLKK